MLPTKTARPYRQPATIHCPLDHMRMQFRANARAHGAAAVGLGGENTAVGVYLCNVPGCPVAYTPEKGYYRISEDGDEQAREAFYAQAAICLCESEGVHQLYIEDYVAGRRVRFWVCPLRVCRYEVSQRLEKTADGWRTCGSFEHTKPVRIRR